MKRIFTFIFMLFAVMTAKAAEPVVVGEDNYKPAGESFAWDFDIDFQTQKFTTTVDLAECTGTNENVASFGTDISNYFGGVYPGGNIHFYYTAETKTLTCVYVSVANESFGVWKFNRSYENVEGELKFDLSYQYGLRMNGEEVFNSAAINNIVTQTKLQFGSKEGSNRSHACYKQSRVEDAPFETVEPLNFSTYSVASLGDALTHSLNTTVSLQQTGLDLFTVVLKNVTVGGKVLGDLTIPNVAREANEGDGNDAPSYYYTRLENGTAVLSNAGALASELGLAEGAELTVSKVNGYVYDGVLTAVYTLTIGDKELSIKVGYDGFTQKEFTKPLATTFSSMDGSYEDKVLVFSDFGDGYAQLIFKDMLFASTGDTNMGNLVVAEVPYTKDGADYNFDATDLTAVLENCPSMAVRDWTKVSLTGKVSGNAAYLQINGEAFTLPVSVTYGTPIAEPKVYVDKMSIENNSNVDERENAEISIRDDGDGNYFFSFANVADEPLITFNATGTVDEETGRITYKAKNVTMPMTQSGWVGYNLYISISKAYSDGDKLYCKMYLDMGGYGANYPAYGYYVTFGNKDLTAIDGVEADTKAGVVEMYNANGVRLSAPQKGLNIVRDANGKVYKHIVK